MTDKLPEMHGFCNAPFTVHTSRTIMLSELTDLLDSRSADSTQQEYVEAIVDENVLGKPTVSSRGKTAEYMTRLYSLDRRRPVFSGLLFFWTKENIGHPLLAALCAIARDSLLRLTSDVILNLRPDAQVSLDSLKEVIEQEYPRRFSPKTLHSTVQNIASSYQQVGLLQGRRTKHRGTPSITPGVVAYSLFLGYLCGLQGKNILSTEWTKLLGLPSTDILLHAREAHKLGWIDLNAIGAVIEVSFPQLLRKEKVRFYEQD